MNQMTTVESGKPLGPTRQFQAELAQRSGMFRDLLPSHISPEKFQRTILVAAMQDPELLLADRKSLLNASLKCAQDGLLPDKREAALVIFKRNIKLAGGGWDNVKEVQYMPMVYGLRKKILQSGKITDIKPAVVYRVEVEKGYFFYEEGSAPELRHRPMLLDVDPADFTDDKIVLAYSIATFEDGSKSYEVMRRFEIDKVREMSQTGATRDRKGQPRNSSGPWVDWFPEQCKKTVMRRHSKTLPMSSDLIDVEASSDFDAGRSAQSLLSSVSADQPEHIAFDPETGEITDDALDAADRALQQQNGDGQGEADPKPTRQSAQTQDQGPDPSQNSGPSGQGEGGDGSPSSDEPTYMPMVRGWLDALAGADADTIKGVDGEYLKHRAALPDDVVADIDAAIVEARAALRSQGDA